MPKKTFKGIQIEDRKSITAKIMTNFEPGRFRPSSDAKSLMTKVLPIVPISAFSEYRQNRTISVL